MADEPVPSKSRRKLRALFRIRKEEGHPRPRVFAVFPTMLTLGNAICGFGAITFATKVGLTQRTGWGKSDTDCLFIAGLLVFAAMVCDMLDGRVARWAKQSSEFGAQLDSLCDAISFGAAPAIILVKFANDVQYPRVLWVIAIIYVCCAILRLARFNVETDEDDSHNEFSGLPSPAAAGTVASFMLAVPEIERWAQLAPGVGSWWDLQLQGFADGLLLALRNYILPGVTFASACLMVSRCRYPHVFNQLLGGRRSARHILQLLLTISAVFMVRELALPVVFCLFAYGAPLRSALPALLGRKGAPSTEKVPGVTPVETENSPEETG